MSKKDKTCIVITSYCNTKEKKDALLYSINNIKKNTDLDILLYSNRIRLSEKYQEDVNYYIFDDRYLLNGENKFNRWVKTHGFKLLSSFNGFGYSAIEQIKNSCNYLLGLGYEHVIFTNYDVDLNQHDFEDINKYIDDNFSYNGICYNRLVYNDQTDSLLIMFHIRKFYNYFNIDKSYYINKKGYENYLYEIFCNRDDIEMISRPITDLIQCDNIDIYGFKDFDLFLFNNNNKLSLFIFNINISEINFKIIYNKQEIIVISNDFNKHENDNYVIINTKFDVNDELSNLIINYNNIIINGNYNIFNNIIKKDN